MSSSSHQVETRELGDAKWKLFPFVFFLTRLMKPRLLFSSCNPPSKIETWTSPPTATSQLLPFLCVCLFWQCTYIQSSWSMYSKAGSGTWSTNTKASKSDSLEKTGLTRRSSSSSSRRRPTTTTTMREMKQQQQQPKKTNSNNNEGNEAANNRGRNKMGVCAGKRVREGRKCSEENGEVVSSICWKKDTREHKWGRNELGEVGTDWQTAHSSSSSNNNNCRRERTTTTTTTTKNSS